MTEINGKQASTLLNKWRDKPQLYFQDVLGVEKMWTLQDELLDACPRAIKEHKAIYVGSGHSLGKDWACGGIGPWFLNCYSPSIVVLTAPTDRQVKKVMYGETIAHWNNRIIDLGGKAFRNPYIEIRKEDWYLIGFTTRESGASKQAAGGKFQGFHAPSVCVIVSEAQAVEDDIYDQVDAILTAENSLVIYIGNPTRASGRFAKGLRDKENNIVFNFSCLENPNYIHKKTMIPGLCSYEWVEDKRRRWGEDDPRWFGRVLGQIPKRSIDTVFSQADIDQAVACQDTHQNKNNSGVALDVAGEGDDSNVLYGGTDGIIEKDKIRGSQSASQNAMAVSTTLKELNGVFAVIDSDGMGIKEWQELNNLDGFTDKYHLIKFHGNGKPEGVTRKDDYQFENLRAEAAFITRDRIREGLAGMPNDSELIEDLLEEKFFENSKGKIQIEEKKDIKERLNRSPDKGDAYKMLQWGFHQDYERINAPKGSVQDVQGHGERVDEEEGTHELCDY